MSSFTASANSLFKTNVPVEPKAPEPKQQLFSSDLFKQPSNSIFAKQTPVTGGDQIMEKALENDGDEEGNNDGAGLVLTSCYKLARDSTNDSRLTTGCDLLTDFFRGGFVPKKLYEIFGESGSGKTQFAI